MSINNNKLNFKKNDNDNARENVTRKNNKELKTGNFIKSFKIKCNIEEIFLRSEFTLDIQNESGNTAKIFIPLAISVNSFIIAAKAEHGGKEYQLDYFPSFHTKNKNIKSPVNVILSRIDDSILQILIDELQNDEKITIKLYTMEILKQNGDFYEFMLYNTIDPRSMNKENNTGFDFPFFSSEDPVYDFIFDITINSQYKLNNIECLTHDVDIRKYNNKIRINRKNDISPEDGNLFFRYQILNRADTALYYSPKSNHFLIENNNKINISNEYSLQEYFFVIDISENIGNKALSLQKELLSAMLSKLHEIDKFNIIFFSSSYYLFSERSLFASNENVREALNFAKNIGAFGSGSIEEAIKHSSEAILTPGFSRNYILLSNFIFCGEAPSIDKISNYILQNKIFLVFTGNSFNHKFAEEIAGRTLSECFVLPSKRAVRELTESLQNHINSEQISEVLIDFDKSSVSDIIEYKGGSLLAEKALYIPGIFYNQKISGPAIVYKIHNETFKNESCDLININMSKPLSLFYAIEKIKQLKLGLSAQETINNIKAIEHEQHILNKEAFFAINSPTPNSYSINDLDFQKQPLNPDIDEKARSEICKSKLLVDKKFFSKEDSIGKTKKSGRKKKLFFDSTFENEADVDIIHQHHNDIHLVVYTGSREEENKINDAISKSTHKLKSGIRNLIKNGLPPGGVIHFEIRRNQEDLLIFGNIDSSFNYIEYDRSVYEKFKELLFKHIISIKDLMLRKGETKICLLEYDL